MARRHFTNTATPTTLSSSVTNSGTTLSVPSTTGYPAVPFTISIDRGSADEEVCLVTAKTSNSFTVTRGYDGSSAFSHDAGSPVEHVSVSLDFDEANEHINDTALDHHTQYLTEARALALDFSGVTGVEAPPVGCILPWAGTAAPNANWMLANGDAISRSTYSDLFAVCGETYGEGDGASTFNIPDMRGRFPLGKSVSGRTLNVDTLTLGADGGEEYHQLIVDELPGHTHAHIAHVHEMGTHRHTGFTGTAGEHTHGLGSGADWFLSVASNPTYAERALPSSGQGMKSHSATDQATYGDNGSGVPGPMHAHNFSTSLVDPGDTSPTTSTESQAGGDMNHQNMPPYLTINYIIRVLP